MKLQLTLLCLALPLGAAGLAALAQEPVVDPLEEALQLAEDEPPIQEPAEPEPAQPDPLGILRTLELPEPVEDHVESPAEMEQRYFEICDHDRDDWISFREGEHSLGLDRDEFAVYDTDSDGRIDREEYGERFAYLMERYGSVRVPKEKIVIEQPPVRTGNELRLRFDLNSDRFIDLEEMGVILEEYHLSQYTPEVAFSVFDANQTGRIEGIELESLANVIATYMTRTPLDPSPTTPLSLNELFGQELERPKTLGQVHLPPLILGPVPFFRRLDVDNDGDISLQDLRELQAPLETAVRPNTVLATLDTNSDGRVSEEEFLASMR